MTAEPDCYALFGAIPLARLTAGRYRLSVLIENTATAEVYDVPREFEVK